MDNKHSDNKFEIAWRKELIKRLEHPMKLLHAAQEKDTAKAIERTQQLAKYESYEDAQNAYGYEEITEDELYRIKRLFDGVEDKQEQSVIGAATDELFHFVSRLRSDIRSFEWEMLPDAKKERIERETAERHAIIEMRRANR